MKEAAQREPDRFAKPDRRLRRVRQSHLHHAAADLRDESGRQRDGGGLDQHRTFGADERGKRLQGGDVTFIDVDFKSGYCSAIDKPFLQQPVPVPRK